METSRVPVSGSGKVMIHRYSPNYRLGWLPLSLSPPYSLSVCLTPPPSLSLSPHLSSKGLENAETYGEDQFIVLHRHCLSVSLPVSRSLCPSVCPSAHRSVSVQWSVSLSIGLSLCPSACPSAHRSVPLSIGLSLCPAVCPAAHRSVSVFMPVSVPVGLSVPDYPSVNLSALLSLSTYIVQLPALYVPYGTQQCKLL